MKNVKPVIHHLCPWGKWYTWEAKRNRLPKCCPQCKTMLTTPTIIKKKVDENEWLFYKQYHYDEYGPPPNDNSIEK